MAPSCDEIWEAEAFTPEVKAERCFLFNAGRAGPIKTGSTLQDEFQHVIKGDDDYAA